MSPQALELLLGIFHDITFAQVAEFAKASEETVEEGSGKKKRGQSK